MAGADSEPKKASLVMEMDQQIMASPCVSLF